MREQQIETIIRFGHQVRAVFDPDGEDGPFAYSIGRSVKDRPELLVTGPIPPPTMCHIINDVARRDDETPIKVGDTLSDIIEGFDVRIGPVDDMDAAQMFGVGALFGEHVTALQILWPDEEGRFPGDPGCTFEEMQPRF